MLELTVNIVADRSISCVGIILIQNVVRERTLVYCWPVCMNSNVAHVAMHVMIYHVHCEQMHEKNLLFTIASADVKRSALYTITCIKKGHS